VQLRKRGHVLKQTSERCAARDVRSARSRSTSRNVNSPPVSTSSHDHVIRCRAASCAPRSARCFDRDDDPR
jgi:hypothetical protein